MSELDPRTNFTRDGDFFFFRNQYLPPTLERLDFPG